MIATNTVSSFKSVKTEDQQAVVHKYFFNSADFLALKEEHAFRFCLTSGGKVRALINFTEIGNRVVSGDGATFGSFDISDNITESDLTAFIEDIERKLRLEGFRYIEIKHWPSIFPLSELVQSSLLARGFRPFIRDINQSIKISKNRFSEIIRHNEKKKLAQCYKAGFFFRKEGIEVLNSAYKLVVDSRERKFYPVTMSLRALQLSFKKAPENYLIFSIYDGKILIATAISVVINSSVLYNFYHADHADYRNFSPTVFLIEGIYKYCQATGYTILDLGISTDKGILNKGLFNFKRNVGCESSDKFTYTKEIG
jgi:hypothetical protein